METGCTLLHAEALMKLKNSSQKVPEQTQSDLPVLPQKLPFELLNCSCNVRIKPYPIKSPTSHMNPLALDTVCYKIPSKKNS